MERLSSGLRINSAKDDAAGQAIAQRNANDGISVAQTAEGALNQVNDNLQRVRELTVQSQNGTNSQKDLDSIQAEIGQRMGEINRISQQTDFNGVKVLSEDQALNIQVGANDGEQISVNLKEITSSTLGLSTFSVAGPDVASLVDQTSGPTAAMKEAFGETTAVTTTTINDFSGDLQTSLGLSGNASVTIADTGAGATAKVDDNGNWYAEVSVTLANDAAGQAASESLANKGLDVAADGNAKKFYVALDPQDADTTSAAGTAAFTVDGTSLSAASLQTGSTADPLTQLDDALRSDLGAVPPSVRMSVVPSGTLFL